MKEFFKKAFLKCKEFDQKRTIPKFSLMVSLVLFLLDVIGMQILAIIISMLFGESLITSVGEVNADAIFLFIIYLVTFAIEVIVFVTNKPILEWFKSLLKKKETFIEGVNIAIFMFCASILYNMIAMLIAPHTSNNNQAGLETSFAAQPFLVSLCVVILAPVCEELAFRFGLFGSLARKSNILAYVLTTFAFAFMHFDFTAQGDALINEFINIPSYIIGAVCLCYAYQRKGNIVTSITTHAVYNGMECALMLITLFLPASA